ncbi:oligosaccharide flippase family protein [Parvularcula dongshanensis]|uniref:O-antigen/teichoic acid export membrane protein n=1 Tax=Parvularcula dongshanensis TaxID=1173995 RepID=A0A840I6X4_9PROT|nr:oligosaccharide flippase family protein [Parvularcula dongshanensis]MBB4660011.1 O-antigen/teichoic acid export membrane protein [Parvularcula dongshanensis]
MSATNTQPRRLRTVVTGWTRNSSIALVANAGGSSLVRFASNLVLSRLLAPEAFGVVLFITSIQFVMALLSETGIGAFIIRSEKGNAPHVLDTVWTISALRGLALALIGVVIAPFVAPLLGQGEYTTVLQVSALTFLIAGLRSPAANTQRRERKDYYNSLVEFGVFVLTTVLTLLLAWWLRSYWGLILGTIGGSAIGTVASYVCYKGSWRRLRIDRDVAMELWRFSRFIAASSALTIVIVQFDKFFIVGSMPMEVVGLYSMAWSLAMMPEKLVVQFSRRVFYPEVAHQIRQGPATPRTYHHPIRVIRPLVGFVCGGAVTFGPTFFEICFDPRYLTAGAFFSILCVRPILAAFSRPAENMMVALGHPRTKFTADVMRAAYLPVAGWVSFHYFGVWGLLVAVTAVELLPILYYTVLLKRHHVFQFRREVPTLVAALAGLAIGEGMALGWDLIAG